MTKNYHVDNVTVEELLGWISQGRIGLPEMQRPFVWSTAKVRDLIDSLYNGYPIGYIVTWQNPTASLKNEASADNKEIIIDGQQRLTALKAALNGDEIIDKKYHRQRIIISFKPSTEEFETKNSATERDPLWIDDIAEIFSPNYNAFTYVMENAKRLGMKPEDLGRVLQDLRQIGQSEIGDIQLSDKLTIDAVTNIFNRINSKGVVLSSADLAMSRLSADQTHNGNNIRKQIEYFIQLLNDRTLLKNIEKLDPQFTESQYFNEISWIAKENNPIYVPTYSDLLHVILAIAFKRGKLTDLVSLVSGRDFTTREYNEQAMIASYEKLTLATKQALNKSNYQRFLMILRDMGMRNSGKLGLFGHGVLNFAYILFLYLQNQTNIAKDIVDKYVKRWIVMAALTGRYSGSSETAIERDIKSISQSKDTVAEMDEMLAQQLSDNFWTSVLPDSFRRQSTQVSGWRIYQMAQIYSKDKAWLAKDTLAETVMIEEGNIHHIFPRAYLQRNGFSKAEINQIANFVWITQPRNLDISDLAPREYLNDSRITIAFTEENNRQNAIPSDLQKFDFNDYERFLEERRHLMAEKIHQYYNKL